MVEWHLLSLGDGGFTLVASPYIIDASNCSERPTSQKKEKTSLRNISSLYC